MINFKILKPLREPPEKGSKHYVPVLDQPDEPEELVWLDDEYDHWLLSNGLCHATEEAAAEHAQALLSYSRWMIV